MSMPAPLTLATPDDDKLFGDLSDAANPRLAALGWVQAVADNDRLTYDALSAQPGNLPLGEMRDILAGGGLSSRIYPSDDSERLVGMRIVFDRGDQQVTVQGPMRGRAVMLILVRFPDGGWRVWGTGEEVPRAAEVFLK